MAKNDTDALFWCVTLPQLQWLLERMTARRDPITRQQVEVFGRHPAGPILPSECIAVERLPDTFGTRQKAPPLEHGGPVHDLAVSPHGELWIATVIEGVSMLVSRGTPEGERHYNGLMQVRLLADEEMGTVFSPRIIGFRPDGTPITLFKKLASCSDSEYWDDDALIFIGGDRAFLGRLPKQCLAVIRVTPGGAVLTAHDVGWDHEVYRNGDLLFRTGAAIGGSGTGMTIGDCWEVGDRIVWTGVVGGLSMRDVSTPESSNEVKSIVHDRDIRDVFMRDGALHYITTGSAGHGANLHRIGDGKIQSVWSSDEHTYLRGYEEFPDGHAAYIGETVRDQRECWVVDGVAAPGFDRVTNLVFRAGRARYWGVLGRHLYAMDLPGVTTPKEPT